MNVLVEGGAKVYSSFLSKNLIDKFPQKIKTKKGIIEWRTCDNIENLLSEKQLALWNWVQARNEPTFSRKDAIEALNFPPRTIEAIIKKLVELKRIERIGEGRATRYRMVK